MAFVLKEGQGSLFKNDRKTDPKHPDIKGSIRLGGVDYWLSGWKKEGRYSLSATPKDESVARAVGDKRPWGQKLDDSIDI